MVLSPEPGCPWACRYRCLRQIPERSRWLLAIVIALFASSTVRSADETRRPNVIVILSDDQGWGDLGVHGNSNLKTPHIDSLAKDGARFTHFYVQPVCAPTRADFLTGRYHPRGGVRGVSTGGERLNPDAKTIADAFKMAGYSTGCFGKWHNGSQYPYHPNGRGFEEYYGFTSGHWGEYFDPPLEHNGQPVRGTGYITDHLTDKAIEFMANSKANPFFCYLAFCTPHSPMQVPDKYFDRFANADLKQRYDGPLPQNEDLGHTRAALAMCENIDWNVGRVLEWLNAQGLAKDTIVVYFSDNGPNGWRWNAGMKGRKGSTDEGGVRSPLFVRWPTHIPAGSVIDTIAGAIDLYPTLADLAGVKTINDKPLDGISVAPQILGQSVEVRNRILFQHWAGKVSARDQRYRLDAAGRLYDLKHDPAQLTDIADQHPADAKRLQDAVAAWKQDVLVGIAGKDDRPYPVGHPEFPMTPLPARDGVPHGGVKRSAGAPNCSFFTNWTKPSDSITWDIEVATPGRYEAVVYYTCPEADLGSEVTLGWKDRSISTTVSKANDPPLRGKEHDRVSRGSESYVKEFAPLVLGTFELPQGRGELTLKATKVPGHQVMDVRAVVLTLKK